MVRKMVRKIFSLLVVVMLAGCASKVTYKKPPQNEPSDDATIKLAEAANSVSDSLIELARIEKETKPRRYRNLIDSHNFNLQTRASVDWSGPVEEVLKRVAKASYFRLRVLGRPPAIPALVSITSRDKTLADILRNLDYQVGKKADIKVYPHRKVIELRYAKS